MLSIKYFDPKVKKETLDTIEMLEKRINTVKKKYSKKTRA